MVRHYIYIILCINIFFAFKAQASVLLAVDDVLQSADDEISAEALVGESGGKAYIFDESLFKGTMFEGVNFDLLNSPDVILPGDYRVDLFVDKLALGRVDVEFYSADVDSRVEPCFTEEFLVETVGVKRSLFDEEFSKKCQLLSQILPEAGFEFDLAKLSLHLVIPQAMLSIKPQGYVPVSALDDGESMLFVNYDTSAYQSESDAGSSKYGYLSLTGGFNFGMWRFRNFSNISYSSYAGRSDRTWNNVRTYVQRALPSINSELTIGDNFTASGLFGGVNYRGLSLSTDERMWAPTQIGYAPEVRGNATTTARVIVKQAGVVVKEITVAPGPFVINDLMGSAQAGDFEVEVVEANGVVSTFVVPYSSVPESMRPGNSKYSFDIGQIRNYEFEDDLFADFTYQRGVSNFFTVNSGIRLADDYAALLAGGVFATQYGAFGLNATYSNAEVEYGRRKQGWRVGLNYSKTFDATDTSVSLAGYRYSSEGFRDLLDAMGARHYSDRDGEWVSSTLLQRNQFNVSVNQSLGDYGSLYISGSASDYYDGKSRSTQLQAGYANSWRDLAYSLSWSRQNYFYYTDYLGFDLNDNAYSLLGSGGMTNVVTLTLSMPLGSSRSSPYLNSLVSKSSGDDKGARVQTGVSGMFDTRQPWSYAASIAYDDLSRNTAFSGSVSTNTPYATVAANYSQGDGYSQYGGSASGSVVAHSGGVTLGPRLSDTFALIEAKGARGAVVRGYSGARVDRFGYALVSSLSPYRYNNVGITPSDTNYKTELLETDVRVAPYAGSSVKVKFETITGYPVLITSVRENKSPIPLGASVYDEGGVEVGMVGQGGQVYARAGEGGGVFFVRWGVELIDQCAIRYELDEMDFEGLGVIRLDLPCESLVED